MKILATAIFVGIYFNAGPYVCEKLPLALVNTLNQNSFREKRRHRILCKQSPKQKKLWLNITFGQLSSLWSYMFVEVFGYSYLSLVFLNS